MSKKGDFISCLSIKPNYTIDYCRYIPTSEEIFDRAMPLRNTSDGKMSRASRSRLMNAINWMVLFSPKKKVHRKAPLKPFHFKVNFITLTLSDAQFHDDDYIKKHLLEPFIKWMKRSHNAINYVWRAESQENGNIHFHITTNKYIYWKTVQNKWNDLQRKHGYLKHYLNKYGDHEAPSTEIKAVKNTKELARYLGKYYAKERPEKQHTNLTAIDKFPRSEYFELQMMAICSAGISSIRRGIDGKQWACSTSLTKLSLSMSEKDDNYWEDRAAWLQLHSREKKVIDHGIMYTTNWNMDSRAPEPIAYKIKTLCDRFNSGDNGVMAYDISAL